MISYVISHISDGVVEAGNKYQILFNYNDMYDMKVGDTILTVGKDDSDFTFVLNSSDELQPEKPYFLIYKDAKNVLHYEEFASAECLIEIVKDVILMHGEIIRIAEIYLCRNLDIDK